MSSKSMPSIADVVIVGGGHAGGGLAAGLTALRLSIAKPDLKVVVLVDGPALAQASVEGTWLFHSSDLGEESLLWIKPLITKSWDAHEIVFPHIKRTFSSGFHALRAEDFDRELKERLPDTFFYEQKVVELNSTTVRLANGKSIEARCVFDARKPDSQAELVRNGFRKSISYLLELEAAHDLGTPLSVDATCPQMDGYRFFRVLPWDERHVMIEEAYHSNSPELNTERLSRSIHSYAERKGWKPKSTERIENLVRVLPMTEASLSAGTPETAIPIGPAGGYYNAATGEELPDAVRFAEFIAGLPDLSFAPAREALLKHRRSWASKQRFYRVFNRFVFFASETSLRYQAYQTIYSFSEDAVARFFGGKITWSDRLRIVANRPQAVTLKRALRSMRERFIHERLSTAP
jgi:lycopene beta-cyclase